jgi:hypothetical protein
MVPGHLKLDVSRFGQAPLSSHASSKVFLRWGGVMIGMQLPRRSVDALLAMKLFQTVL